MLRALKSASKPAPARQTLAAAITERNAAKAELEALEAAAGSWDAPAAVAVREARAALEAATASIATAQDTAADYFVAAASGQAIPPPLSVSEARAAEKAARDNLAAAESSRATLQERIPAAEQALQFRETAVAAAVSEVLKSSPETAAVLDEVEAAVNTLWRHSAVLQAIASANGLPLDVASALPGSDLSRAGKLFNRLLWAPAKWERLPPVNVSPWDTAFKALHEDASTALPAV